MGISIRINTNVGSSCSLDYLGDQHSGFLSGGAAVHIDAPRQTGTVSHQLFQIFQGFLRPVGGEQSRKGHRVAGHGYGLITIQEDALRLGGDMLCYTEDGSFVLDVMVRVGQP